MNLRFLTLDEVLLLHKTQTTLFGGDDGLRDKNLLLSAIAMPEATFGGEYLHPTLPEMAAAYLFHLVKNHPFVDGNKRTGAAAAATFVIFNGFEFTASSKDYEQHVLAVASGQCDKPQVVEFFKAHVKPK